MTRLSQINNNNNSNNNNNNNLNICGNTINKQCMNSTGSKYNKINILNIRKNIFACLFSIHNTISLSCREQVCLSGLRFKMGDYPDDERSISRNIAHLNILVHDMMNLLYYNILKIYNYHNNNSNSNNKFITVKKYSKNKQNLKTKIDPYKQEISILVSLKMIYMVFLDYGQQSIFKKHARLIFLYANEQANLKDTHF